MKRIAPLLLLAACTTISTPPPAAELPSFSFAALRGSSVEITVVDKREGRRDAGWEERIRGDVAKAFATAGVAVSTGAQNHFEIRIDRAESDIGHRQREWNACVQLAGQVSGASTAEAAGDACVTQHNARGVFTAKDALHQAYDDALARLLSALDAKLRPPTSFTR
jgi:hypothetical protein